MTDMLKRLLLIVILIACASCDSSQKTARQTSEPASAAQVPVVTVTTVQSHELERVLRLPGELQAWQDVALYARVQGFVDAIPVDRGTLVRKGQLIARLRAPEMGNQRREAEAKAAAAKSQLAEARARMAGVRAQRIEAETRLATDESTYRRMKAASATPGVVAGNDIEVAVGNIEAARTRIQLYRENEKAAQAQVDALTENERALREAAQSITRMEEYLNVVAPFDGVVTERNAHPGSLAAPGGMPLVRVQMVSRLRLLVAVPEAEIAGIRPGTAIPFSLPAFPGDTFSGVVKRSSLALDPKTRTMPVELDVANTSAKMAPGMMPEVLWPTRRSALSLFVPPAAIATTTERTFLVRIRDGQAEWVDVKRGAAMTLDGKDLIEVFGALSAGDVVSIRGTDELREGTRVNIKQSPDQKKP